MTHPNEAPRIRPAFRVLGLIIGPALMAGMGFIIYGCWTGTFLPDGSVEQDCAPHHRAYVYFLAGLVITCAAAVGRDPLARLRRPSAPLRKPDAHS